MMGLTNCPDCGREVSDRADFCPNCGCPGNYITEAVAAEERRQKLESLYESACLLSKYESANDLRKARTIFEELRSFRDSEERYKEVSDKLLIIENEQIYQRALALLESSSVDDLRASQWLFSNLGDYQDSQALSEKAKERKLKGVSCAAGDRVIYGRWNNDPIEWRVLDVVDGIALLVTEKGIELRSFNQNPALWNESSLRLWLNEYFFHQAFDSSERMRICEKMIPSQKNPQYYRKCRNYGPDTFDKVFCLSIDEAEGYFTDNADRICKPTEHVIENASWNVGKEGCRWWLRTVGYDERDAASVEENGKVRPVGYHVGVECLVRPAMWLDL